MHYATYDPGDDKLRIYTAHKLPDDEWQALKALGFGWAPKQGCIYAVWSPSREDAALDLCGEIGDEDTSLVERAEVRAERFEGYEDNRRADADRAHKAVAAIADNIPLGQPILVGHHSERHARRDAEKIQRGMEKAVRMWDTANYWKQRAAGALRHAQYKELPAVRARRIKGLESDLRKQESGKAESEKLLALWLNPKLTLEMARKHVGIHPFGRLPCCKHPELDQWLSAYDVLKPDGERYDAYPSWTLEQCQARASEYYPGLIANADRWIAHLSNRLEYERAMLAESGGLVSDRVKFEVGGRVLRRGSWYVVTRVNPQSVSVRGHFATTISFDEISDYQPPAPGDSEKVKKATKTPPLCNYPGDGFVHMTRAELDALAYRKWSDEPKTLHVKATETVGAHRVQRARQKSKPNQYGYGHWEGVGVFVTDAPRKDPPRAERVEPVTPPEPTTRALAMPDELPDDGNNGRYVSTWQKPADDDPFVAMREALRSGVQVVSAPDLFPTPADLAARVVDLADIRPGDRVLEPSAGLGNLIAALPLSDPLQVVGVEINFSLAEQLRKRFLPLDIRCSDFLSCNGDLGTFDRIVMNPPFSGGEDIKHILHARKFLRPGGRLVALCANGPRQRDKLQPIAREWIDLPPGSFAASGTNVNAAIVVLDPPEGE